MKYINLCNSKETKRGFILFLRFLKNENIMHKLYNVNTRSIIEHIKYVNNIQQPYCFISMIPIKEGRQFLINKWDNFFYKSICKTHKIMIFKKFLYKHKAYDKFINNLNKYPMDSNINTIELLLKSFKFTDIIEWGFNWHKTKEAELWHKLSMEWRKHLNMLYKNYIKKYD